MKSWLKIFICFIFLILFGSDVNALNFYTGSYITGEYITRVKDGKYYYLTGRYIEDSKGNVLYCLEPFVSFDTAANYTKVETYPNLSKDILRRIELISYYGYGYGNRTSSKWYVITQFLIWKTVSSNDIYFTDTLNGKRIIKYENEMNEILSDVNKHEVSRLVKEYTVSYNEDLVININGYKVISSDFEIVENRISNVKNNGKILVSKVSNYYGTNNSYYEGGYSQDLMLRGNISNPVEEININVLKSNIILDINVDNKALDFNVCYDIISNDKVIDNVCTNDSLDYKSIDLSYGNYKIKQSYVSEGYEIDDSIYEINLGEDVKTITFNNKMIKNKLEIYKYYCYLDNCRNEGNAIFDVYDINSKLVGSIKTDEIGYGSLDLIYGKYIVRQSSGIDGYDYVNDFNVNIDSLLEEYKYRLNDNKIVVKEELEKNEIEEEKDVLIEEESNVKEVEELKIEEVLPPNTGVGFNWLSVIGSFLILIRLKGFVR